MSWIRVAATLLVLMVLAAACSSGEATEAEPTETGPDPAPFDAVLLELFGTTDTEAYLLSAERTAAEFVKSCMEDAGFEFEIPSAPVVDTADDSTLDYAGTQGFGIIARFRREAAAAGIEQQGDPNVSYLTTLTAAEIERFFLTLDGALPDAGQRAGTDGCNGQASEVVYADWLRFFERLPNYTALGEERDTHPDWLEARAEWRTCMTERGFDYAEPDDIRADVITRMRETVEGVYAGGRIPLVETEQGWTVEPEVDALLQELTDFEIGAAIANYECTEPLADRFAAVEFEVQQGFVDRNRDAIDELLALAG